MAQVFISYNKRDRALAERVAAALCRDGLSIWWDDQVTPREQWDRTLEREIGAADKVLVLWTRNAVDSDWVRIEANFARGCRPSKLVQARFDHCTIPIAFSLTQYVDLDWERFDQGESWKKLLSWLQDGQIDTSGGPPAKATPQAAAGGGMSAIALGQPPVRVAAKGPLWLKGLVAALGLAALVLAITLLDNLNSTLRVESRKAELRAELRSTLDARRAKYDLPPDLKGEAEAVLNKTYSLEQVKDRYSGMMFSRYAEFELSGSDHHFRFSLSDNHLIDRCYEDSIIRVWSLPLRFTQGRREDPQGQVYRGRICVNR